MPDGEERKAVELPVTTQALVREAENAERALYGALGRLEYEYLTGRAQLLRELEDRKQKTRQLLDGAARALSLDIDNQRWHFDSTSMTFSPFHE